MKSYSGGHSTILEYVVPVDIDTDILPSFIIHNHSKQMWKIPLFISLLATPVSLTARCFLWHFTTLVRCHYIWKVNFKSSGPICSNFKSSSAVFLDTGKRGLKQFNGVLRSLVLTTLGWTLLSLTNLLSPLGPICFFVWTHHLTEPRQATSKKTFLHIRKQADLVFIDAFDFLCLSIIIMWLQWP